MPIRSCSASGRSSARRCASFFFEPQAEDEILEGAAYYRDRSADAAQRFADDIEALIGLLLQFPRVGSPVAHEVRRVLLSNFPYQFIYRVEETRFASTP